MTTKPWDKIRSSSGFVKDPGLSKGATAALRERQLGKPTEKNAHKEPDDESGFKQEGAEIEASTTHNHTLTV